MKSTATVLVLVVILLLIGSLVAGLLGWLIAGFAQAWWDAVS